MHRILTYRSVAVVLAVLFCLFNIGLPIVVASCPMMQSMKTASMDKPCCEKPSTVHARIGKAISRDCCKTVYAAERNTHEFLQVHAASYDINGGAVQAQAVLVGYGLDVPAATVLLVAHCDSPPIVSSDLPVLYSSLLV